MSFDPRKAAQTIAYFSLRNGGEPIDVLKVVKLVYLADRESISQYGFPIQEEARVSMKHGPVNSETYAHIQGESLDKFGSWSEFLRDRDDHKVGLQSADTSEDDLDELSEADLEVLSDIWGRFGQMEKWELVKWTHDSANIPEWEDPGGSSSIIPLERMMRALNIENASEHAKQLNSLDNVDRVLKGFG